MKLRVKNPRGAVDGLVRGCRLATRETHQVAQPLVPVDTGFLQSSGSAEDLPDGGRVIFTAPYAAKQEWGIEPGTREDVPRHTVRRYRRMGGKHGRKVVVGQHQRGPFTRVYERGMIGRFYLTSAWEAVRPRLSRFLARGMRETG